MKKIQIFLSILMAAGILASCSTKVDLYADYKDIPVIYGLLDSNADTNYVKIIRAFSGSDDETVDATQVALIPDSNNYPGKLDAKIYRLKQVYGNQYEVDATYVLDTMTIHDKDSGAFYFPNQKVYYTNEKILSNTTSKRYRYRLEVIKGNDTVSSETGIVGGESFKITTTQVSFVSEETDRTGQIKFVPADNAEVYNLEVRFYYKERHQGETDWTLKSVRYSFGMKNLDEIDNEDGIYFVNYSQNLLFNLLNAAIGNDIEHVERTFHPKNSFVISLAAGGEELYSYITINQGAGGLSQNIPDYTNIKGGYGVFSSRVNLEKTANLSARTQTDLIGMPWHFSQEQ